MALIIKKINKKTGDFMLTLILQQMFWLQKDTDHSRHGGNLLLAYCGLSTGPHYLRPTHKRTKVALRVNLPQCSWAFRGGSPLQQLWSHCTKSRLHGGIYAVPLVYTARQKWGVIRTGWGVKQTRPWTLGLK